MLIHINVFLRRTPENADVLGCVICVDVCPCIASTCNSCFLASKSVNSTFTTSDEIEGLSMPRTKNLGLPYLSSYQQQKTISAIISPKSYCSSFSFVLNSTSKEVDKNQSEFMNLFRFSSIGFVITHLIHILQGNFTRQIPLREYADDTSIKTKQLTFSKKTHQL